MGNDAAAKPLLERALSIREKALGPEHNYTASSVTDLAEQLCLMDESSAAGPLYERAIAIREKVVPGGLDLATSIASFAACLWSSGDPRAALIRSLEAESLAREQFRRAAIGLSQREAMNFEAERTSGLDIGVTALSGLQKGPALAQAAAKVLDDLIRSRAMVLDEMAGRHRAQVVGSGSELARLRDAYDRASRRLARLLVNGPDDDRPEAYRADLLKTRDAFDAAERALASKSAGFSRLLRKKQAGLAEVRSSLPRGSSLVSYVLYGRAARQLSDPPVPSYLAFVLKAGESAPVIRMLGTADEIDRRVARWRNLVAAAPPGLPLAGSPAERDYREAGSELRAAIWDPIASALEGSRQVFIVPDAALHLVSFATLPVGETRYLVENGPLLHYLSAERDLVEAPSRSRTGQGLLVLGGPDFDSARRTAGPSASTGLRDAVSSQAALRGDPISCEEFRRIRFEPLPGAGAEIGEIASIWERRGSRDGGRSERVLRLTGAGADEASLKHSAHGFGIVHLATHGFFVDSERCGSLIDGARKGARRGLRVGFEEDTTSGGNPLLLAGLALAGANGRGQRAAEEEDGILTAEEIATIDLSGVDWVVLSACETGIGKVTAGEGVLGLRRAFEIAGAGTLITSLWSVEDVSTRSWMRSLYENRLKGLSTAEAVRRADLDRIEAMRSAGGTTHPYYWSGFVAAGDWR
jgi:CHAT domain-containing protein